MIRRFDVLTALYLVGPIPQLSNDLVVDSQHFRSFVAEALLKDLKVPATIGVHFGYIQLDADALWFDQSDLGYACLEVDEVALGKSGRVTATLKVDEPDGLGLYGWALEVLNGIPS